MAAPKPKAVKMSEIKSRLMSPATTSNYEVFFGLPSLAGAPAGTQDLKKYIQNVDYGIPYTSDDQVLIHLSCQDASLPGSNFATHEITNDFTGVTEKHAYRRQYDGQIDFSFFVDKDYRIIRFFEAWMGYIIGDKANFDPSKLNSSYRVKFPKAYQTNALHITKFEKDIGRPEHKTQLIYTFVNAFPISVASTPVSYGPSDLLRYNVTMSYSRYYVSVRGYNASTLPTIPPLVESTVEPEQTELPTQTIKPKPAKIWKYPQFKTPFTDYPPQVNTYGAGTIANEKDSATGYSALGPGEDGTEPITYGQELGLPGY